jgi:hypothetical protein
MSHTPGSNTVFWTPDGESFMLQAEYFSENPVENEKSEF